ncbi:MAG: hypothetical protein PUG10_04215 [Lachnospiraceae bacterium]|nr:hypothetical protein [Lachnospiraceae bacterium]
MGIIKGQIELRSQISAQKKRIEILEQDNETYFKQNTAFKNELTENKQKIMEYVSRYEQTGLECEFCYGTLQVEFQYCPKCGKRVERKSFGELNKGNVPRKPEDLFQYEDDRDCILITKYNGFADKRIIIPSTINGKRVIGIWNGVFARCKDLEEVIISCCLPH